MILFPLTKGKEDAVSVIAGCSEIMLVYTHAALAGIHYW